MLKHGFSFFLIESASADTASADAEFSVPTEANDLGLDEMEPINPEGGLNDGMASNSEH